MRTKLSKLSSARQPTSILFSGKHVNSPPTELDYIMRLKKYIGTPSNNLLWSRDVNGMERGKKYANYYKNIIKVSLNEDNTNLVGRISKKKKHDN